MNRCGKLLAMNLPQQCLKGEIDLLNKALEIKVAAGQEEIITWSFTNTIRQNLLALTMIDDSGNPQNYLLAKWRDTKVQYDLQNTSGQVQLWYVTGWEVNGIVGGGPTLDCPGCQDGIKSIPSVNGPTVAFLSETPYYDGAGIHPGDTLATVRLTL